MQGELAKYSKYELASWIREFVTKSSAKSGVTSPRYYNFGEIFIYPFFGIAFCFRFVNGKERYDGKEIQ